MIALSAGGAVGGTTWWMVPRVLIPVFLRRLSKALVRYATGTDRALQQRRDTLAYNGTCPAQRPIPFENHTPDSRQQDVTHPVSTNFFACRRTDTSPNYTAVLRREVLPRNLTHQGRLAAEGTGQTNLLSSRCGEVGHRATE